MKKNLLKKFYAFIITAMLFSASANAQIVYTDVNPDFSDTCTFSSTNYSQTCNKVDSIDLNNDGIFDLKLSLYAFIGFGDPIQPPLRGSVNVSPLHGTAIKTDTSGKPLSMNLNDVIDSSGSWMTTANQTLIFRKSGNIQGPPVLGNWITATDKHLGLKILSGSQTNYCWVRLNVAVVLSWGNGIPPSASFTIKDYAYNSIPNQAILAGQTTTTGIIENSFASSINLFPNPATDHLTIAYGSNDQKVEVTIADINGKIIYSTTASDPDSYREQKIEVNTKDFAEGIYVVRIQAANFIETKKLVVAK